jgi:hypothetical protein
MMETNCNHCNKRSFLMRRKGRRVIEAALQEMADEAALQEQEMESHYDAVDLEADEVLANSGNPFWDIEADERSLGIIERDSVRIPQKTSVSWTRRRLTAITTGRADESTLATRRVAYARGSCRWNRPPSRQWVRT